MADAYGVTGSPSSANLGLAIGVLAIASAALLIRLCGAPSLAIAAWRMDFAAAACLLVFAWRRPPLDSRALGLGIVAGAFLGLHFATWISSLAYTTVTSSVLLVTTNPIFVALGSTWILRERVGKQVWLGIALSMAGVLTVGLAQAPAAAAAPDPLLGNALALAGAIFGSAYYLIGRRLRATVDTLGYVTVTYGAAAVLLTAMALAGGVPLVGFTPRDWLLLLLIAAIPQGIGHTLINWSLGFLPPARVAVAILGEPIGAALMAYAFLREPVTWAQAMGGVLVLAGVGITARKEAVDPTAQL